MAKKKKKTKGLSKTQKLRKNIKAVVRRRQAEGWNFDPIDLATIESGNYQQLKALQRDNYRKLYEHAEVINYETGEVITGRQAQIYGRWKGGMWDPQGLELNDDIETDDYVDEDEQEGPEYDESALEWGNIAYDNIINMYGQPNVSNELLDDVKDLIDDMIDRYGRDLIYYRLGLNATRFMRLVQLYVCYYDPLTLLLNERQGDPELLQEMRQLLDPYVSLEDLEDYAEGNDAWADPDEFADFWEEL